MPIIMGWLGPYADTPAFQQNDIGPPTENRPMSLWRPVVDGLVEARQGSEGVLPGLCQTSNDVIQKGKIVRAGNTPRRQKGMFRVAQHRAILSSQVEIVKRPHGDGKPAIFQPGRKPLCG